MKPFKVRISPSVLEDLKDRLKRTRWPDEISGSGWSYGANLTFMKELVAYWQDEFDWNKQEKNLNQLPHFQTEIDGYTIHFIHVRGKGNNLKPIILLHGWPGSFVQMEKIIPLLTGSFDVVVPSLIGYGFSDPAKTPGMNVSKMAGIFHTLMTETLGYTDMQFGVTILARACLCNWQSLTRRPLLELTQEERIHMLT